MSTIRWIDIVLVWCTLLSTTSLIMLYIANMRLIRSMRKLTIALDKSLSLQSHYASILNDYDEGRRKTFTIEEWLDRLEEMGALKDHPQPSPPPQ